MTDEYVGEQKPRRWSRIILLMLAGILAALAAAIIFTDVPFLEDPLREFLFDLVPQDAIVWKFIGIDTASETVALPPAVDEPIQDMVETVIDTSDQTTLEDVIADVPADILDVLPAPEVTSGIDEAPAPSLVPDKTPDTPQKEYDLKIPEFEVGPSTILSDDARFSTIGKTVNDGFAGIVDGVDSGNSMYVDGTLLVLVGVRPGGDAAKQYLTELCPSGSDTIYDVDDYKSPRQDGGIYAKIWCFGAPSGIPDKSANELALAAGAYPIDYSCIGSEFGAEDWSVSAGCLD